MKALLKSSDLVALQSLAAWRKVAHFVHANSFAQYFLLCEEWTSLLGLSFTIQNATHVAQRNVAKQCQDLIARGDVDWNREVPKMRRNPLTMTIFRELCAVQMPGSTFFEMIKAKYGAVWSQVPSIEKIQKRLLVEGEAGLRSTFLTGLSRVSGNVQLLDFADSDPDSELGIVVDKLATALAAKELEAKPGSAEVASDPVSVVAVAALGDEKVDVGASVAEGASVAGGDTAIAAQATASAATASTEVAAALQDGDGGERAQISADCRIALDEALVAYSSPPVRGGPMPEALVADDGLRVFVVPTPPGSRGRPKYNVRPYQNKRLSALQWLSDEDVLLVGLGHEAHLSMQVKAEYPSKYP